MADIKKQILVDNDLSKLGISCYLCSKKTHISVDCPDFKDIEGNLNPKGDKLVTA